MCSNSGRPWIAKGVYSKSGGKSSGPQISWKLAKLGLQAPNYQVRWGCCYFGHLMVMTKLSGCAVPVQVGCAVLLGSLQVLKSAKFCQNLVELTEPFAGLCKYIHMYLDGMKHSCCVSKYLQHRLRVGLRHVNSCSFCAKYVHIESGIWLEVTFHLGKIDFFW